MTVTSSSSSTPSSSLLPLLQLLDDYPLSPALSYYEYGTAGFRFLADWMDGLMVRVGMLAILLQQQQILQQQQDQQQHPIQADMGIMITASHNDESYNGVKLANPDGSMLTPTQEEFLVYWVNERDHHHKWTELVQQHHQQQQQQQQEVKEMRTDMVDTTSSHANTITPTLHLGMDTRSHSSRLSRLCQDGAYAMIRAIHGAGDGTEVDGITTASAAGAATVERIHDHGIVTTPMLHHIVLHSNPMYLPPYLHPQPTRDGYIHAFAKAYIDLCTLASSGSDAGNGGVDVDCDDDDKQSTRPPITLHVDGACGVGHHAIEEVAQAIQDLQRMEAVTKTTKMVHLVPHNGPRDGPLNDKCGSEHVQKQLSPPQWYDDNRGDGNGNTEFTFQSSSLEYCCALDGDADRIVFFGQKDNTISQLLDGDKIAILIAHVLVQKFDAVYNKQQGADDDNVGVLPKVTMGIVQTAYANGASTDYVKNTLQVPVVMAKTGVKHLHHAAVEHFDIGIYFEANGHGTVIFSKLYERFAIQCQETLDEPFFVRFAQLINPAVGDAISDLLLVDYLLRYGVGDGGWTLEDWNTRLYKDLPSRMLKVTVQDRNAIVCNDNETECIQPESVQPMLVEVMKKYNRGRTFVRPSGTEDVVRVYAEAATRDEADALATAAAQIVFDVCRGVGARPV